MTRRTNNDSICRLVIVLQRSETKSWLSENPTWFKRYAKQKGPCPFHLGVRKQW